MAVCLCSSASPPASPTSSYFDEEQEKASFTKDESRYSASTSTSQPSTRKMNTCIEVTTEPCSSPRAVVPHENVNVFQSPCLDDEQPRRRNHFSPKKRCMEDMLAVKGFLADTIIRSIDSCEDNANQNKVEISRPTILTKRRRGATS